MQSVLEYCLFISILAALLGAMQLFGKRGLSSSLKAAGDTLGFQMKTDAGFTNETERNLAYLRGAKTTGRNVVKSASKQSINANTIQTAKASVTKTSFQGASVSRVLLPREGDMRRGPDKVDNLIPIIPSELLAIPGIHDTFQVFKKIGDSSQQRALGSNGCDYLQHSWGQGSGYKNAFEEFTRPTDEKCKNSGNGKCDTCKANMCVAKGALRHCRNTIEYKPLYTHNPYETKTSENVLKAFDKWDTDPSYAEAYVNLPASSRGGYVVCLSGREIDYGLFTDEITSALAGGDFTNPGKTDEANKAAFDEWIKGKSFFKPRGSSYFPCAEVSQGTFKPHCDARARRRQQAANRSGTICDILACGSEAAKDGHQYDFSSMNRYDPWTDTTVTGAIHKDWISNVKDPSLVRCRRSFQTSSVNVSEQGCAVSLSASPPSGLDSSLHGAYNALVNSMGKASCTQSSASDLANINLLIEDVSNPGGVAGVYNIDWVDGINGNMFYSLVVESMVVNYIVPAVTKIDPDTNKEVVVEPEKTFYKIGSYKIKRKNPWENISASDYGSTAAETSEVTTDWTANNAACFQWTKSHCDTERDEFGFKKSGSTCQDKQVRVNSCATAGTASKLRKDHDWCRNSANVSVDGFTNVKTNYESGDKGGELGGGWGGEGGNDESKYTYYTTLCNIDHVLSQDGSSAGSERKEEVAGFLRFIQAPMNDDAGQDHCRAVVNVDDGKDGSDAEEKEHNKITKEYFIFIPESSEQDWGRD